MPIVIREIHPTSSADALNQEWFVVENAGERPFSTSGCSIAVGRGKHLRVLGQLDPGFTLAPGEKIRVITGNPGKKAHGKPPEEGGVKNYHLFMAERILAGKGSVVALSLKQHEIVRGVVE
jgi:hypothetical protein